VLIYKMAIALRPQIRDVTSPYVSKVTGYSSSQHATPLLELTCHMGSHSVTCHPAEVAFQPLLHPKLVLDLATPEGCKSELT